MPDLKPEFLFDFGSPNAYLSHLVIPGIEHRTGVRFEYVPILVGGIFRSTGNSSPVDALRGIKNKPEFMELETARFLKRHQITTYKMNPFFPVNTLQIMRGAVAAQELGCLPAYENAVFAAMWERELNMADPEVISRTLDEVGLDAATLLAAAQHAEVKARLAANTQEAFEAGAFGAPTFFVGAEIFFGKDRLREVEEELERQKGAR